MDTLDPADSRHITTIDVEGHSTEITEVDLGDGMSRKLVASVPSLGESFAVEFTIHDREEHDESSGRDGAFNDAVIELLREQVLTHIDHN